MFEKAKLTFKDPAVFEKDFKTNVDTSFCIISKMLFNNRINIDGSIDLHQGGFLRKYELWSYIYYLYYYNNSSVEEFVKMKNPQTGKASALLFYESVRDVVDNQFIEKDDIVSMDVNTLIYFINFMVHKYGDNLRNPVVDYLKQLVYRMSFDSSFIKKLKGVSVVTGNDDVDIKIVTKPEDINSSNIKVVIK
jgi:hypothetical protein